MQTLASLLSIADRHIFASQCHDASQDVLVGDLRAFVRNSIGKTDAVLEIGPSHAPMLPRAEGYNTKIVDHASAEEIANKYSDMGIDVSHIESVDFIWRGGDVADMAGKNCYKYVFASHVIEHVPDLVSFLNDCLDMIVEDGRLMFLVPDKRFCFDFTQPLTDTAKVLSDFYSKRTNHSFEAFYREDSHMVAVMPDGKRSLVWTQEPVTGMLMKWTDPHAALAAAREKTASSTYIDAHEYYFTPSSFHLLLHELRELGLARAEIELLTRARGCEFLVVIKRGDGMRQSLEDFAHKKAALATQIVREIAESFEILRPPLELVTQEQPGC